MVAGHEEAPTVELRRKRDALRNRSEGQITEVQDDVVRTDERIPPSDHDRVHLLDGRERPARKLTDPRMAEVMIARDEADSVKIEVVLRGDHQAIPPWTSTFSAYTTAATCPSSRKSMGRPPARFELRPCSHASAVSGR